MRDRERSAERLRNVENVAPRGRHGAPPGEYVGEDADGREYRLLEGHVFSLPAAGAGSASWVCDLVAPNRRRRSRCGERRHPR